MALYTRIMILRDDTGLLLPKPRELNKKNANCIGFGVWQGESRGVPHLHISRCMTEALRKKDNWNDDGRPPTLLFSISYPSISLRDHSLEVVGFETANLCMAGIMVEPYEARPRPYAERIDNEDRRYCDSRETKQLFPQHIVLL